MSLGSDSNLQIAAGTVCVLGTDDAAKHQRIQGLAGGVMITC